jgi:hypothetical protein
MSVSVCPEVELKGIRRRAANTTEGNFQKDV